MLSVPNNNNNSAQSSSWLFSKDISTADGVSRVVGENADVVVVVVFIYDVVDVTFDNPFDGVLYYICVATVVILVLVVVRIDIDIVVVVAVSDKKNSLFLS